MTPKEASKQEKKSTTTKESKMKVILKKIGMAALLYVLTNETIHNAMRNAAKKTTNVYDDAGVEAAIKFMNDVAQSLKA